MYRQAQNKRAAEVQSPTSPVPLPLFDCLYCVGIHEHLVLQTDRAGDYSPGDILVGIPWHVCPTSALRRQVFVIDGGELVDRWDVASRDRWITI